MYKHTHQNPELGFMETRTAGIVAKELTDVGFDVQTGIGKTGVVGIMRNGPGSTVITRSQLLTGCLLTKTPTFAVVPTMSLRAIDTMAVFHLRFGLIFGIASLTLVDCGRGR
jgi:hypothetical protein